MKKKVFTAALILSLTLTLCACGGNGGKLSLEEKMDTITMKTDEKYTVKIKYDGNLPIEWESGNEAVAVVSPDGTVSAVGSGITTVTARTQEDYVHIGVIVKGDGSYTDEFGNHIEVFDGVSDITEISVGVRGGGKGDISQHRMLLSDIRQWPSLH